MSAMQISHSPLDEARFGIKTAKASHISLESISAIESYCQENAVKFCIARVTADALDVVQGMEATGFRLMDTLVYYAFKFGKKALLNDDSGHRIRPIQPRDIGQVKVIAEASFQGYYGHYHADPRLNKADCDAVYTSWAVNSASSKDFADEVLVVEGGEGLNGFATLRMNDPLEGEGVLFGVAPQAQGQGIYRTMMIGGMHWVHSKGAERMVVSTQLTNIAVQKVWARLGFEMDRAYYTFHKWYD